MDSLEQAPGALSTLEGSARGASLEACASLEDGAPVREPPLDDEVVTEVVPLGEAGGPSPRARHLSLALFRARRIRPPDKLILGSYVKLLKWSCLVANTSAPDQEVSPVAH